MALLDIHGHDGVTQSISVAGRKKGGAVRILALMETALENPLLPALLFGILFHLLRFVFHLAFGGAPGAFLPASPLRYLSWLPEFVVPYFGLLLIAIGYKKTSRNMHDRIIEGLERGNEIQKVSILGFAKISEVRDPDTGDHIIRMSHYSRMLAQEMSK